jgi:hypothetical protein
MDQCLSLDLIHNPSRLGADAWDHLGHPFELKTTSKGSVSTARDLSLKTLDTYATRYWVVTRGKNFADGFHSEATYFLAPEHMEGWYAKIRSRFEGDLALIAKVMPLVEHALSPNEIDHLKRVLDKGMKLNDPNIPWGYIKQNGIEITDNPAETLKELVNRFPLDWASVNHQ